MITVSQIDLGVVLLAIVIWAAWTTSMIHNFATTIKFAIQNEDWRWSAQRFCGQVIVTMLSTIALVSVVIF